MADVVSPEIRSRMMAGIRGTNTMPELVLRRALHRAGFRFRIHVRDLPGKPDLVFPRRQAALFAHGCFWHGHNCHLFKWPKSHAEFWHAKIDRNRVVDARNAAALKSEGWRVGIVWECALRGRQKFPSETVIAICADWLRSDAPELEIRGRT